MSDPAATGAAEQDARWMTAALAQARLAAERGEVPVGCVIVDPSTGRVIGSGHDGKELFHDPTAHAEVLAMRRAASVRGDWRLDGCDLYVTLEPCPMCAGAAVHARIRRVIFGAWNPRWGVESNKLLLLNNPAFNHRIEVTGGVMETECAGLLRETFRAWRK